MEVAMESKPPVNLLSFSEKDGDRSLNRRTFLLGAAALVSTAASQAILPRSVDAQAADAPADPTRIPGAPPTSYGKRSAFERTTRLAGTSSSLTPLQDLHGMLTPSALHFERHHNGVPRIDPTQHRLLVHGLVERPMIFTLDELKRFPAVSR